MTAHEFLVRIITKNQVNTHNGLVIIYSRHQGKGIFFKPQKGEEGKRLFFTCQQKIVKGQLYD
jgi:hypothetical protein